MEMPNSCPSSLDPTHTLTTLPRAPGGLSVGQRPHCKPSPAPCISPFHMQGQLDYRPLPHPRLSLSLSAPSLWPCSILPLPSPGGGPKCSLYIGHLLSSFFAFPVDMAHLTSTHSHRNSGPQGPIQREIFHPPHPSPLLPLSPTAATSCPRECQDPTGTSLAAENGWGGGREGVGGPTPSPCGACTASDPIYLLSVAMASSYK